jgi:hypothetical protein
MNFEKYSKQQFELNASATAVRQLADKLQDDVVSEIHEAVYAAFMKVVEALNAEGHNLKPFEEVRPGDISFRDVPVEGQCHLRLACDVVISAGFSDLRTADEIEAEIMKGSS